MNKFCGFTLAEVLITLAVVGVVAAMTMPTLIRNYQKMTWTNQLKKSYSTLAQALEKMKADEGVTSLGQTELASAKDKVEVYNILSKYIKTTGIKKLGNYKFKYLNLDDDTGDLSDAYGMFFADGSMMITFILDSTNYGVIQSNNIAIDVNGEKGPNIVGRDVFYFVIYYDKLYARGDRTLNKLLQGNKKTREWENGTSLYNCRLDKSSKGAGCAARILEKGKMDY